MSDDYIDVDRPYADLDPIPVHVASWKSDPIRAITPEYAACNTWSVDTITNMGKPIPLLTRRYRRDRAQIFVPSMGPIGTSVSAQGNTVAPAGGTSLLSIATPTPGLYNIEWVVSLTTGTPAAADIDNVRLRQGATILSTAVVPAALGDYPQPTFGPVFITGATSINLQVIGNATAGVGYAANVTLVPIVQTSGAQLFINNKIDPLTNPTPQGAAILVPGVIEWHSQQPCYAVLGPTGGGPVSVSVIDYTYEEG